MAKKVVATIKNTSGIKYAKLIRARKSEKNGAYNFKEEIVIEDHVKEILAGKDPQELIEAMRRKQEASPPPVETKKEASKEETAKEEAPKEEAPKEETAKEEAPKEETAKEEAPKEEAPKEEAPKEEAPKEETAKEEAPK